MPTASRTVLFTTSLVVFLLFLPGAAVIEATAQPAHPLDVPAGKALFERFWVAAPASTAASDGLGPLYNARSCAECHPGGGASAAPEHLVLRLDDPIYGRQLQTRALAGLQPEARLLTTHQTTAPPMGHPLSESISLHGTPTLDGTPTLNSMGHPLLMEQPLTRVEVHVDQLAYGVLGGPWSLRMPPSLQVVGGIAAVRDSALLALADPDDADGDGISGRVSWVLVEGVAQVGRYGWKAEGSTLAHQVACAFSLDLGLGSAAFPDPHGDCTAAQTDCLRGVDGATTGDAPFELADVVPALVVAYLQSLQPGEQAQQDVEGLALFSSLGCQACHVLQLDGQWLFSDLLLHDMGPALASGLPEPQAELREWRTAPLSALSGKARFLHDGRASTLSEAIFWHGGEAAQARSRWLALSEEARNRLNVFLKQL
ncbi:MAG TPA: thiol oxidoreductase [Pseudomonadaceae bacterium]|nr:thiol oxidoreductase [Pseudomonadaceae bacterium]